MDTIILRPSVATTPRKRIHDGAAYIAKIRAVSGNGGHNVTFRAACCLRDAGMDEAEALLTMLQWNKTNAEPRWSDLELLHKVRDAMAARGSSKW